MQEDIKSQYLDHLPKNTYAPSNQKGSIEKIQYSSHDYTKRKEPKIIKNAYVYLPYEYNNNPDQQYDIIYCMHGWTMTSEDFFFDRTSPIVNILDNLIASKEIKPLIFVTPTFDANDQPQDFSRSVEELFLFYRDFRENLMPTIEKRYRTYAKSTDDIDLKNSRDHRFFSGFSLGAVTTWSQFEHNLQYISKFIPMSGDSWIEGIYGGRYKPRQTVNSLEKIIESSGLTNNDFHIFAGIGTVDPIWGQVVNQMQAMMESRVFNRNNTSFWILQNGRHDLHACGCYLYHALKQIIPYQSAE